MTDKTTSALKLAEEALVYHTQQTRPIQKTDEAIAAIREALAKSVRKCDGLLCNDCGEYKQKYKDLPGLTEKDLCVCEPVKQESVVYYAYATIKEYEKLAGFSVSEAFRAGWNMARTTNSMLGINAEPVQPVKQQPVAWAYFDADGTFMDALDRQHGAYQTPLYAAPVSAEAIRAEAFKEAAEWCEAKQSYNAMHANTEFAAGIRGLK